MKVGILTLPFNNNYGGYLQAYALMTVLKQKGCDVELIYRRENRRRRVAVLKSVLKNVVKILCRKEYVSFYGNPEAEFEYRGKKMLEFADKYLQPRTMPLFSSQEMYQQICENGYDVVIIGSDQVWRPDYGQKHVQDFFLTELQPDKIKYVSYAASFGSDDPQYTTIEIEECGKGLRNFEFISVREERGLGIIKDFCWVTKHDPIVVLDPTMLLSCEHYNSLLPIDQSPSFGKIFCYVLDGDDETKSILNTISTKKKMETYSIIDSERWKKVNYVMPSIEDWLTGIRDAEFVFTDSYHGMVFSIIFNKPFFVKFNAKRGGNRFVTLLKMLGLEERMVYNSKEVPIDNTINWLNINTKIKEEILKSDLFINGFIKS